MRRVLFVLASLVLSAAPAARAIPGATDRTAAATLLVPFFQTGIDAAAKPHDTLIVVHNTKAGTARIHYEVWDIDGRNFAFTQYNESGAVVASGMRRLDPRGQRHPVHRHPGRVVHAARPSERLSAGDPVLRLLGQPRDSRGRRGPMGERVRGLHHAVA